MGEDKGALDCPAWAFGACDHDEGVVRKDVDGGVREEPDEAPALRVVLVQRVYRGQSLPAAGVGVPGDGRGTHPGIHALTLPAVVVLHPGDLDELRVYPRQVIVLHEVLTYELVVRADLVVLLAHQFPLFETVAGATLRQVSQMLGEGRGVRIEVYEDQEAPTVHVYGHQAVVSPIKALDPAHVEDDLHVLRDIRALEKRGAEARPLQIVCPGVVRTAYPVIAYRAGMGVE